ncbi:MAG: hypothetical protein IJA69_00975, partial [Clostridia bacterium]|nr:hypothetical protein [Clostridia bacterium]
MSLNSSTNTTTDNNGAFAFKNIDGTSIISGALSYNGCKSVSTETIQVTASNAVNKVVTVTMEIDLEDYIYFLFERGYKLLNDASSSYVKVDGVVNLTMGGTQYVGGTRKRDSKGVIFTEKTNYGETTLGIDPKVAVLTYYNTNNGSLKYQQVKAVAKKEDGSGYSVTYGSFTDISLSEYQSLYGIYPYDNYAYTINQSQITSYSGFAKADGLTTFKLTLNANSAAENYKQQMYQLSGQRPAKFNYIYLTYTIDDNGYIRKLDIDEQYVVEVAVVSVTGTGDLTETFMIYDKDTKLTDVNLNDIEGSLAYKVANAASNMLDLSCQQINKRRKYEND